MGAHPLSFVGAPSSGGVGDSAVSLGRVRDVVFSLLDKDGHPVGCGFFVTPCGLALTVNHGVSTWSTDGKVSACKLHCSSSSSSLTEVDLSFSVVSTDADLDFTVLRLEGPLSLDSISHFPLPVATLADDVMWGKPATLVHGNLALNLQFHQRPEASVVTCNISTVHSHLLLYTAATYVGDSGGALLLMDGQLVGMHKEGMNDVVEEAASPTTGRKKRRYKTLSEAASISTSAAALRLDCEAVRAAVTSAKRV